MSKGGAKQEVTQYFMSLHYGLCAGPVDKILRITVDDKVAWEGEVSTQTTLEINKPDLFGGIKKEGGLVGLVDVLPGNSTQLLPSNLASKLGRTPSTCPAYRGITSLWFYGAGGSPTPLLFGSLSNSEGFYWSANSPYVQGIKATVQRAPVGLDPALAMIGDDANPAHMIYEALTNTDWSIGAPPSTIDVDSFNYAAQILKDEGLGLSFYWQDPAKIEDFIADVINHIEGQVIVHPRTGKWTLKLIRDDYDPEDLRHITVDNATLTNFQRKLWGETINEIVVEWTNPENEETETVSFQDLANITMQGGVVSETKNYPGVRSRDLAMNLASRDLRVAAAPMMSCEAVVNRTFWDVTPGDVVKVSWPRHGMVETVMRVGPVDYGKTNDSAIRLQLIEDVFSLPQATYTPPQGSLWTDPSEDPFPLAYGLVWTLSYYHTVNSGANLNGFASPSVLVGVLGAQPGNDTDQFILTTETADAAGNPVVEEGSYLSIVSRATLAADLPFAVTSTIDLLGITRGRGPVVGGFALMGTNDEDMEICVITSVSGAQIVVNRGVLDTTPKAWPAGTGIWFFTNEEVIEDATAHAAETMVEYRPLTKTSKGILPYASATPLTQILTYRPHLPSRPANVKVNGSASGTIDATDLDEVTVTWVNRNRLLEDSVVMRWDDASVTPEDGQTTTVTLYAGDGSVLDTIDGLTGTSSVVDISAYSASTIRLKVTSKVSGLESIQGHSFLLIKDTGWGLGWGTTWGG